VVLVVAGHGDDQVGPLDAGALQDPELGGVAVLDRVLELLLDHQVAAAVALEQRDLLPLVDQLARQVPADLAGAADDYVHALGLAPHADTTASSSISIATWVGQMVCRPCSR